MIINCTPHAVTIISNNNCEYDTRKRCYTLKGEAEVLFEYMPSGIIPRVSMTQEVLGEVDGVTLKRNTYGEIENLPPYEEGNFLIVSAMCAQACPDRRDLLIPTDMVRDEAGAIVGCLSFSVL